MRRNKTLRGGDNNVVGFVAKAANEYFMFEMPALTFIHPLSYHCHRHHHYYSPLMFQA
jgi:hypothetical protein